MKVKESYKFTDDKTEMAGVVAEPKVSGSLRRMRACEEEYDVCSSLPRSVSAESEFHTGVKGESPRTKNTMIDLVKILRDVFLMRANYVCISRLIVQQAVKRSDLRTEEREKHHTWTLTLFYALITTTCEIR